MTGITHIACSDESNWNAGRFRSIALVTAQTTHFNALVDDLVALLANSTIKEFKWKKLSTARERFAALKLLDFTLNHSCKGCLRVDVMVWDIEDTRHAIQGRDDSENLQRMYYHLFKDVLRKRWPDNSIWMLYPDEHTSLDWECVKDFLGYANSTTEINIEPLLQEAFSLRLKREFSIYGIKEASAGDPPLVQLADLFAGMAAYSREAFERYRDWQTTHAPQQGLFVVEAGKFTNSEMERFYVLQHFDSSCKSKRMGVSLKSHNGLRTLDPKNPINFWWYEPQHEMDKAPTRQLCRTKSE